MRPAQSTVRRSREAASACRTTASGAIEDAVAGGLGAPAQVDVVAHQGQPAVEAAELLEDVAADQHARGGHGQHGADVVVLALVLLAAVQAGPAAAASWRW